MRKLVRAVIIIAMVTSLMIAQTFTANAGSAVIYVTSDKTVAEPGDTINFTVSLSPVSDMGSMQMVLDIPEGLTYVSRSGKLAGGLKRELGFDFADFTELSLMINGGASASDYSSDSETVLCTFSCTADEGFRGKVEVGLTELEFYSCETWEDHTGDYSVSEAVIMVGADDGQGSPSDSGKSSDLANASGSSGFSGSQEKSENTSSEGQSGNSGSPSGDSVQPGGSEDPTSDDAEADTSDGASGGAAADKAEEEQSSSSIWLIAIIAVLLIAVVIAVFFKRRKKQ